MISYIIRHEISDALTGLRPVAQDECASLWVPDLTEFLNFCRSQVDAGPGRSRRDGKLLAFRDLAAFWMWIGN